jgi:hypothetical protein
MKKFDLKPYLLRYGGREAPSGQRAAQPLC